MTDQEEENSTSRKPVEVEEIDKKINHYLKELEEREIQLTKDAIMVDRIKGAIAVLRELKNPSPKQDSVHVESAKPDSSKPIHDENQASKDEAETSKE